MLTSLPLRRLLRLASLLLALATVALVWRVARVEWQTWRRADTGASAVAQLRVALLAAEQVSRERGPTNAMLGEPMPAAPVRVQALAAARVRTDQAWATLANQLPAASDDPALSEAAHHFRDAQQALRTARAGVDALLAQPKADRSANDLREAVRGMVAVVPLLGPAATLQASLAQEALPALGDPVQAARLAAEMREHAGQLGSHFTAALTRQQPFTPDERAAIERTRGRIDQLRFLTEQRLMMPGQTAAARQAWQQTTDRYGGEAGTLLAAVIQSGQTDGRFGMSPADFASRYVPQMDSIVALRDAMLDRASALAEAEQRSAWRALLITGGLWLCLLLLLMTAVLVFRQRVLAPLAGTVAALKALANNSTEVVLPQARAQDELAEVLTAVQALQQHARQRLQLETERDELIQLLRGQSNTDFLTGLPNRRAFFDAAERELAQAQRHGHPVSVLLLDLDRFKQLNDTHGHATGDQALLALADVLRQSLRQGDLVARYGGEEFVVLLAHTDLASGLRFAERLREAISALPLRSPTGTPLQLAASMGVADSARHGHQLMQLLSRADAAMYAAKQAGRNRVQGAD